MVDGGRCPSCGTELADGLLACPSCRALVHAAKLKELAATAEAAQARGDDAAALSAWREASALLPPSTRQHAIVARSIETLSARVLGPAPPPDAPRWGWLKRGGPLAAIALFVWKLKSLALLGFANAKLVLLGLGKMTTLLSMAASLGFYWIAFGWRFAAGLIASIYLHEMGHVAALRSLGIAASAPMFIPGLGALVRLKQYPATPAEDARVGLAGPLWGLGAAIAAYVAHRLGGGPTFAAIAHVGAWINLFNLLPIWQLDGGRGLRALSRWQRFFVAAIAFAAWRASGDGMVLLLLLVLLGRAAFERAPPVGDRRTLVVFSGLVAALSALASIAVPGGP